MTGGSPAPTNVVVVRMYDDPGRSPGDHRVLVDRLWPRGVKGEVADLDDWAKDLAPSTELRRWYGHEPQRFDEFARRYRHELAGPTASAALDRTRHAARRGRLVLLTGTRDVDHSAAAVLRSLLEDGEAATGP